MWHDDLDKIIYEIVDKVHPEIKGETLQKLKDLKKECIEKTLDQVTQWKDSLTQKLMKDL